MQTKVKKKHLILSPTFERADARGLFHEVLNEGKWETLLSGRMKANAVMGNHYHKTTTVFFYLTSGSVTIKTIHVESKEQDQFTLRANQGVILPPNESHVVCFLEPSDFIMLKSQRYISEHSDTFHFPVSE